MNTVVCTLFEKHYHYGLAAFVDSLHKHGFSGEVYAGFRGTLPEWALPSLVENKEIGWEGTSTMQLPNGLKLHFLPLTTDFHLSNYKPQFMLELMKGVAKEATGIVYFDPDIIIKCQWDFFETWISYGVSLVHEVLSNDMPASHPVRLGWAEIIKKSNREIQRNITSYINAGFCGVSRQDIEFLEIWADFIEISIKDYGFHSEDFIHKSNRAKLFFAGDQDAFNIAAMCSRAPISEIGPEGMDFMSGGFTMSHAVGSPKPWKKNFIASAFKGVPPSGADKIFWSNVSGPIRPYTDALIKRKKMALGISALIGRFYKRG